MISHVLCGEGSDIPGPIVPNPGDKEKSQDDDEGERQRQVLELMDDVGHWLSTLPIDDD